MNTLILAGAAVTMTSREIAELTGSTHDSVLKTVRRLVSEGVVSPDDTPYVNSQNGQTYPQFLLSFRDTMVVVSGYSSELRAKIIDRWQELESVQAPKLPQTMAQALRLAADQAEQLEVQAIQLQAQQPAVEFVGHYVEAGNDKSFREVAKILGIPERHFFADLAAAKIIFKQGRNWLPFAHHQDAGRFTVKTGVAGDHAFTQTRFTPEGIAWIARRYASASNDSHVLSVGVK